MDTIHGRREHFNHDTFLPSLFACDPSVLFLVCALTCRAEKKTAKIYTYPRNAKNPQTRTKPRPLMHMYATLMYGTGVLNCDPTMQKALKRVLNVCNHICNSNVWHRRTKYHPHRRTKYRPHNAKY